MIRVRTLHEVEILRQCGQINADVHQKVAEALEAGITTLELDEIASQVMQQNGAKSSIMDAYGFPGHICISVNDEVGHGVPGDSVIRDGDLVTIDVSVQYEGYHTDCAVTHMVGSVAKEAERLVSTTRQSMWAGIEAAMPGNHCSDISHAIHSTIEKSGFSVVRTAFGHGIGTELHESPSVANFGPPHHGPKLRPGMVIAIEPVVSAGKRFVLTGRNGWTDVTVDNSLAAHFEHTVVIHEDGSEVLTQHVGENSVVLNHEVRTDMVYRGMKNNEEGLLFEIAAKEMDPILIEAWGRRANYQEIFGIPNAEVVVLEQETGELAGFYVVLREDEGVHLNTLVIRKSCQGRGIGKHAMKHIEAFALSHHVQKVTLCVQTTNHSAIAFYRKLGYRTLGPADVNTLFMERSIG